MSAAVPVHHGTINRQLSSTQVNLFISRLPFADHDELEPEHIDCAVCHHDLADPAWHGVFNAAVELLCCGMLAGRICVSNVLRAICDCPECGECMTGWMRHPLPHDVYVFDMYEDDSDREYDLEDPHGGYEESISSSYASDNITPEYLSVDGPNMPPRGRDPDEAAALVDELEKVDVADVAVEDMACPICYYKFDAPQSDVDDSPVKTACCRQIFGRECLTQAYMSRGNCPMCRGPAGRGVDNNEGGSMRL
jgi:hypothetical protein